MNIALVLSGGSGSRMQLNMPKQYVRVNNRMIITYVLEVLAEHETIDCIQIVSAQEFEKDIEKDISSCIFHGKEKFKGFSEPGKTRQLSILSGLRDIKEYSSDNDIVLIQDAARPMVSTEQISACIEACIHHDGAMPVLPMKDTVYMSRDGRKVSDLVDRDMIYAGQAPEAFKLERYLEANESLLPDRIMSINGSTEPAVLAGLDIAMIPGDEKNFKITTIADLERFKDIKR
ncbi:MAG: 2-C-methyl-D-erythritol 4-phosphate cytidylyltransferase [Lachnospiraceae bacterium]|nr:2-C-methyl-D-erythritol 4-phosphate cytidylyltransferase [Lachnospiraceae bacterium]